jgi:uncharacterized membrane protein YcaP (DUF421 family)
LDFVWKSLILVFAGILLLRVAGRKSISQMTLAQTVVMISVGSIIIQPIIEDSVWKTIVATAIFVASLLLMEYLQLKFNFFEKFITGKLKIIIENGQIDVKSLKKLRFSVDQLEMRLRQQGVTKITDVQYATLEPNGQLGYELKPDAQPLTVGEFKKLMSSLLPNNQQNQSNTNQPDLFEEIKEGQQQNNPDPLH